MNVHTKELSTFFAKNVTQNPFVCSLLITLFLHVLFFYWFFLSDQASSKKNVLKQPLKVHTVTLTKPTAPAKTKPATSAKTKPATPVKKKPATPAKTKPATPVKTKPSAPAKTKPATPAKTKPTTPVKTKPSAPAKTKPATPAKTKPKTNAVKPKKVKNTPKKPVKAEQKSNRVEKKSAKEKVLKKLRNDLAKIDSGSKKIVNQSATKAYLPTKIEALSADHFDLSRTQKSDSNYLTRLKEEIRRRLKLPEYGEVLVKLTVDKTGTIKHVVIVSGKSQLNQTYIQQNLPHVKLPPFGNNFSGQNKKTFEMTLLNE